MPDVCGFLTDAFSQSTWQAVRYNRDFVPVNRILKFVNILIAIALLMAAAAVYWYVYRVLPDVSGTVPAPIAGEATVTRDAIGVPHIRAKSIEDALFLQGYVTAQDRLWQMDLLRRVACGELSEVFGAAVIEVDRETVRLGMRRIVSRHYNTMTDPDRKIFAAYARGVNHFLETHRNSLPVEFRLLGYDPRPWRIEDSMAIGLHMFRVLTASWRDETLKRELLSAGGDAALVNQLLPSRTGLEAHPGSNAWAIAGSRTVSGKPILAADPHLDWSHPASWYLAHLEAPFLNVSGATLPGVPAVMIGHNEHIAWGVTVLYFDVQDLYIEKINLQTGQYAFQGRIEQAEADRQLIAVKGQAPQEILTWVTRHGPVVVSEGGAAMALRWTAAEPGGFSFPFLDLNAANNLADFNQALARLPGPGLNFVYADSDGNIGYRAAGKLPIRRNFEGDVPADGSSGQSEWDGYIPFEELPHYFNPAGGVIVSANQNLFPENYAYRVHGAFDSHFRSRQILDRLNSRPKWDVAGQLGIQTDVYSAAAHFLAKQAVAAFDRKKAADPKLAEPVRLLRAWDGQMVRGTPAPFIAALLYQYLRRAVVERAAPGKGLVYENKIGVAVVDRLVRERPSAWFNDYDDLLIRSLSAAAAEADRLQGREAARWDYGQFQPLRLVHPILGRVPYIGKYFDIGPVPMSGSSSTVKQTTSRLGPSMRMVANTGDWDASVQNITIGQSGQPLSGHFKDQWNAYYAGTSFPMQFRRVDAKAVLRFQPTN
jgi:penicillin amidase